jgi:hypothetical protein
MRCRQRHSVPAAYQDPKTAIQPTLGPLKASQLLVDDRERQFDSSLQNLCALIHRKI